MNVVLAVDIGGTNLRQAIVGPAGTIIDESRCMLDLAHRTRDHDAGAVDSMLDAIVDSLMPAINRHQPQAVGAGFPGFFDDRSRRLVASPNLPYVHDLPLADMLAERLGVPVFMQNDALCAALGEHRFGAGQDVSNLLHLTLGTGIGGGLILDGRPWSGEFGMAAEFGHLRIRHGDEARPCGCGKRGCVEAHASATAIQAIYHERTGRSLDAQAVHARALAGDEDALDVWREAGFSLGMAIAQCIILLDIHCATLSGGLTGAWYMLEPAIREALESELIPPQRHRVSIMLSRLGERAGILGAAELAQKGLAEG